MEWLPLQIFDATDNLYLTTVHLDLEKSFPIPSESFHDSWGRFIFIKE